MDIRTHTAKQYKAIRRILRGNPPLEPEPWQEITTHDICPIYVKWLAIWLFAVLLVCFQMKCAHAQDVDLDIIAQIESSNNPSAYNADTEATGLYQITPICLKDYNDQWTHTVKFNMRDMFVASFAYQVANWYLNDRIPSLLRHYGCRDTIVNRLVAYNAGIYYVIRHRLPHETKEYIEKYQHQEIIGDN